MSKDKLLCTAPSSDECYLNMLNALANKILRVKKSIKYYQINILSNVKNNEKVNHYNGRIAQANKDLSDMIYVFMKAIKFAPMSLSREKLLNNFPNLNKIIGKSRAKKFCESEVISD